MAMLRVMAPLQRSEFFLQLRPAEQRALLALAPPELAAVILWDSDSPSLRTVLSRLDLKVLTPILALIPSDELANLLLPLTPERRDEVLGTLDPVLAGEVRTLLRFDPDTAGGFMKARYLSVPDVVTVSRALDIIRGAKLADSASYIYVVDSSGRLVGTVPLRSLLVAEARTPVRALMQTGAVCLKTSDSRADVLRRFDEHPFVSLPVVDDKERLEGIVTFDEMAEAAREQEQLLVHGVTGAHPLEVWRSTWSAARGRLPWLGCTIVGGLGCALLASLFQEMLAEIVILGMFIPLVLAIAESVAAQTISVLLSSVSRDVPLGERTRFIVKQVGVGSCIGVVAGCVLALVVLVWRKNEAVAAVVGGAACVTAIWATLLGTIAPLLLRRAKVEPAVASGPLVLAMVDVSALAIYLGGASLVLR